MSGNSHAPSRDWGNKTQDASFGILGVIVALGFLLLIGGCVFRKPAPAAPQASAPAITVNVPTAPPTTTPVVPAAITTAHPVENFANGVQSAMNIAVDSVKHAMDRTVSCATLGYTEQTCVVQKCAKTSVDRDVTGGMPHFSPGFGSGVYTTIRVGTDLGANEQDVATWSPSSAWMMRNQSISQIPGTIRWVEFCVSEATPITYSIGH